MSKVVTIIRAVVANGKVKIRMEGIPLHLSQSMVDLMTIIGKNVKVESKAKECWKVCEDCDCIPKQNLFQ